MLNQQDLDILTGRQQDSFNARAKEAGSSTHQQRSKRKERSYRLVAAIVHSGGGTSSGHYYAYCWEDAATTSVRPAGVHLPLQEVVDVAAGNHVNLVDLADLQVGPLDPLDLSGPRRQEGACPAAAAASGLWWMASDREVREAEEAEVLGCEATALFYEACIVGGAGL